MPMLMILMARKRQPCLPCKRTKFKKNRNVQKKDNVEKTELKRNEKNGNKNTRRKCRKKE